MNDNNTNFEVEKSFGLGVLLKLTKKNFTNIEISSDGEKFTSNVNLNTIKDAVNATMEAHNISLDIK